MKLKLFFLLVVLSLLVTSPYNGISYNYILDLNLTEININISDYPIGIYTIALVADGEIVDAKTLVKQ